MSKLSYPQSQEHQQPNTFSTTSHSTTTPAPLPPIPLKRTRAKRSCDFCRKRKSRCDADTSVPCSNCRAWGYNCEFQTVRKKRGPPSVYVDNLEKRCRKMERLLVSLTKMSIKELERHDFQYDYESSGVSPIVSDSSSEEEDEEDDFDPDMDIEERLSNLDIKDYDSIKYTGHSAGLQFLDHNVFKSQPYVRWPGRDDVVLRMMGQDEVMIVRTDKGSNKSSDTRLDVGISMRSTIFDNNSHPLAYNTSTNTKRRLSKQLSDKMIEMYFTHIHPFLPFINKQAFLARYRSSQGPPSILVDALLALSLRFSSQHFPNLAKDAKEHAEDLFRKVMKRLRDSHRSRLSHVQAALLVTLCLDMDDGDVESLQWCTLGTAIRMAQDLGLHRACDHWNLPPSEKETRHRVYYTLYILDRWIGARAGKPLTILDRDFDTTMPSPYEVLDSDNANSRPVYRPFVLLIRLSEILGRVLKALYAPNSKRSNSNAGLDDPTILAVIDRRLRNWKSTLDEAQDGYHIPPAQKENLQVFHDIVLLLLHRPFLQASSQQFPELETISAESRRVCTEAASDISNILCNKRPDPADADTYFSLCLPTWHVYAMFQSSLVHLSNALHDRNSEQKLQTLQRSVASIESHKYLCSAMQAIEILKMLMTVNGLPLADAVGDADTRPSLSTPLPTYHHYHHPQQQQQQQQPEGGGSFSSIEKPPANDDAMLPVKEESLVQPISLEEEYPKSNHLFERMINCSVVGGITPDIRREVESVISQQPVNCFLPQPETAQISMNYNFYQQQLRNPAAALGDPAIAAHHPSTYPFDSNNNNNDSSFLYHQASLPFTTSSSSSSSVLAPDPYIAMSQQQPFTTAPPHHLPPPSPLLPEDTAPPPFIAPAMKAHQQLGWNDWDAYFDHSSLQPNAH